MSTAPRLTEKQWAAQVRELAALYGWHGYHTFDSRRSDMGWPDLVLWRERIIFVELKTDAGRVSEDQARVMAELAEAGAETYVLRPKDFNFAREVLARRAA